MRRWIVVASAFGALFVAFGSLYAFGIFFGPLQEHFGASRGAVAWVIGIGSSTFLLMGVLGGSIADRFGVRPVFVAGGLLVGAGLAGASRASALWHVYLGQGFVAGLGIACLFTTSVGAVARWFPPRRRGLAMGIAVAGSGVGTLAYAPVSRALVASYGWRTALLVLAAAGAGIVLICAAAVRGRGAPPPSGMRLGEALRSRPFRIIWASGFLASFSFLVPFAHIVPYARDHGMSPAFAALLLSVMGGAGTVGRLAIGPLADRSGHRRAFIALIGVTALVQTYWLLAATPPFIVAFAAAIGFVQGGFITLLSTVTGDYFGTANLAGIFGLLNTCGFPGSLLGPPAAGALFDALGSYTVPIGLGAAATAASFLVLLRLPHPE